MAEQEFKMEPGAVNRMDDQPARPTAAVQLREFEDRHMGEGTPRIAGKLEDGSGAPRHHLPDDVKALHAKLERLVVLENDVSHKAGLLAAADAAHRGAVTALENAHKEIEQHKLVDHPGAESQRQDA